MRRIVCDIFLKDINNLVYFTMFVTIDLIFHVI